MLQNLFIWCSLNLFTGPQYQITVPHNTSEYVMSIHYFVLEFIPGITKVFFLSLRILCALSVMQVIELFADNALPLQ